jgi:hypothetical protein
MKQEAHWKKERSAAVDFVMAIIGGLCLLFTVCNEVILYQNAYGREVRQPSGALAAGQLDGALQREYELWSSGGMVFLRVFLAVAGVILCAAGIIRLVHLCGRKRWIAYLCITILGVLLVGAGLFGEIFMLENPNGIVTVSSQEPLLYLIDLHYNEYADWNSPGGMILRIVYWLLAGITAASGVIGAARCRFRNNKEDTVDTKARRQKMLQGSVEDGKKQK